MKIRIKTLVPVTHQMWQDQSKRFATATDNLISESLPLNVIESDYAIIELKLLKPLLDGFKAEVNYIQTYTKDVDVLVTDDVTGVQSFEVQTQNVEKSILKYIEDTPFPDIDPLLAQVDALIDPSIIGLSRIIEQVKKAIILDVVAHITFGALLENQYEVTIV